MGQNDPLTLPDTYTTRWSETLHVEAPGVLGNDTDPDGDQLSAHLLEAPIQGILILGQDGGFSYVPEYGQTGPITFIYKAWDGRSATTATVTVEVTEGNHQPEPIDDAYTIVLGARLEVSAPGVLANDNEPDGDPLTTHLYQDVAHGHLGFHQDGSFWYDPQGFVGTTSFRYGAYDGQYKRYATVSLTVTEPDTNQPPTITSNPPQTGAPHQAYIYQIEANDPDGDPLSYSMTGPEGMRLTGQRLTWVPETGGSHEVTISVSDGVETTRQSYSLAVSQQAPHNRPPRITSQPMTHLLLRPVTQPAEPMDLHGWSQWDYEGSGQTASWQVSDDGTAVYQPHNGRPSFWVDDTYYRNLYLTGSIEVATVSDNDYIGLGIVTHPGDLILFRWKQGSQEIAQKGMSVVRYRLPAGERPDFWATEPGNGELLYRNTIGWQEKRNYDFALELHPGELSLILSHEGNLVDHISVVEPSIRGGYIGLFNYSQEKVWYRAMAHLPLASRTYTYEAQAHDPDGDALTWSLRGPPGLTIESDSGTLSWDATSEDVGSHLVSVTVTDPHGASDSQTYRLSVSQRAPVIVSTPNTRAQVGQPYLYDVAALSPLEVPLLIALEQAPVGMSVEPGTGVISWLPDGTQIGAHDITLSATDSEGNESEQTYNLTVREAGNQPPRILSELPRYLPYDEPWSQQMDVEDEGPVSFELTQGPETMAIHSTHGLIAWRPDRLGEVPITVTVTDAAGLASTTDVTLLVVENGPPQPTIDAPAQGRVAEPYRVNLTATEPDGDPLSWRLLYGPGGLSLEGSELSWTPTAEQEGEQKIGVLVTDGLYQVASSWTVSVSGNNTAPILSGIPSTIAHVGEAYEARFYGYDAEGQPLTYAAEGIAGLTIDPGGILRLTPGETGSYSITVSVTDTRAATTELTYGLTVREPGGSEPNTPPVFLSQPPTEITVGDTYRYQPELADAEGDPITLELIAAPTGCQRYGKEWNTYYHSSRKEK